MADSTTWTEADVRARYEQALWAALDYATAMAAIYGPPVNRLSEFTKLTEELGRMGWGIRLVFGPQQTGEKGLFFYRVPKDEPRYGKQEMPIEAMTDRELLCKLSDMVYAYDRSRDAELHYLEQNPMRDAWDEDQIAAYKEIREDAEDQYAKLWKVLDHIDRARRSPQTAPWPKEVL